VDLIGVDAETGVFMLLYLDLAYHEWQRKGRLKNWQDVKEAILQGGG
jgi:Cu(I)/Ag(I) efflux system membrane protein CusA/SilA